MAEEKLQLTKEGLKKLQAELDELKTIKRKEVAERLREAISYGDLSENSEYEEAKNEQAFVEGRIIDLEQKIKNVQIIGQSKSNADAVNLGSVVEVENLTNKEPNKKFTIVGTTEVEVENDKISNESPLGAALVGQKKGATVSYECPAGKFEYKIVKIS